QRARQPREALLGLLELLEVGLGELLRSDRGDEALELGANEERLPHLLARERADTEAAVRLERDETERRQTPQGLADRRAADRILGRDLLLSQDRARLELARDDRLFERECDLVGLRAVHGLKFRGRPTRRPRPPKVRDADGRTQKQTATPAKPASPLCGIASDAAARAS